MKKIKFFFLVPILMAFALGFSGCASTENKAMGGSGTGYLEPSYVQKFTDIPVPRGFKFLPAASYAFKSGDIRAGVLIYQGLAPAEQVMAFYQQQMPMHKWSLLNLVEYGNRLMNYDRENESCVINIIPRTFNTRVIITIGRKELPAVVKASETPVK